MADAGDRVIESLRQAAVVADAARINVQLHLDGIWFVRRDTARQGVLRTTTILSWDLLAEARSPLDHMLAAIEEVKTKAELALEEAMAA